MSNLKPGADTARTVGSPPRAFGKLGVWRRPSRLQQLVAGMATMLLAFVAVLSSALAVPSWLLVPAGVVLLVAPALAVSRTPGWSGLVFAATLASAALAAFVGYQVSGSAIPAPPEPVLFAVAAVAAAVFVVVPVRLSWPALAAVAVPVVLSGVVLAGVHQLIPATVPSSVSPTAAWTVEPVEGLSPTVGSQALVVEVVTTNLAGAEFAVSTASDRVGGVVPTSGVVRLQLVAPCGVSTVEFSAKSLHLVGTVPACPAR